MIIFILDAESLSLPDMSNPSGRQIQIEDREHTPSQAPSVERRFDPFHPMVLGLGLTAVFFAISVGMARSAKHNAAPEPPTGATAGPSTYDAQRINPPQTFVAPPERAGIHSGLPVDTASEPHPNSRQASE